jgi:uncharacterized protein
MASGRLRGRHALVTGASSGLGADFARELAARGAGLTLVARREERLRELQRELGGRQRARIEVIVLDLTAPGAPDELLAATAGAGHPVDVLVNNAGYGLTASSAGWTGSASATCSSST